MKSIFAPDDRQGLIVRIGQLNRSSPSRWGTMDVGQMVRHCLIWDEWIQGRKNPTYKREFLGFIFGKMALRSMIKDERPFDQNIPTAKFFHATKGDGDFDADVVRWISLIKDYERYDNPRFVHDFFGKMTVEQIGILAYKHTDHHVRQFGA